MQEMHFATEGVTLSGARRGEDCIWMAIRRSPHDFAGAEGAKPAMLPVNLSGKRTDTKHIFVFYFCFENLCGGSHFFIITWPPPVAYMVPVAARTHMVASGGRSIYKVASSDQSLHDRQQQSEHLHVCQRRPERINLHRRSYYVIF